MSEEVWRPVANFAEYEVSDQGRVRRGERLLRPWDGGNGYLQISFSVRGKVSKAYLHRIVCTAFHGDPPSKSDAAHWNGDRHDNRAENLRWASRAENMRDGIRLGRHIAGERNGHARLSEDDVRALRSKRRNGSTYCDLADEYGLAWQSVRDACIGKNWSHIPLDGPMPKRRSPSRPSPTP